MDEVHRETLKNQLKPQKIPGILSFLGFVRDATGISKGEENPEADFCDGSLED